MHLIALIGILKLTTNYRVGVEAIPAVGRLAVRMRCDFVDFNMSVQSDSQLNYVSDTYENFSNSLQRYPAVLRDISKLDRERTNRHDTRIPRIPPRHAILRYGW